MGSTARSGAAELRDQQTRPHAQHRSEVDREYQTSQPHVGGQDVNGAVRNAACDEDPCQPKLNLIDRTALNEQQARGVEHQRPLELVGEIGARSSLDACPGVGAV